MNYHGLYWLAGLFDGEGCIPRSNNGYFRITLAQKGTEILQPIKQEFGGNIYFHLNKYGGFNEWALYGQPSLNVIQSIYLLLSQKRRNKFREICSNYLIDKYIVKCDFESKKEVTKSQDWIKWAAGFLDGEGHFRFRKEGTLRISAPQKNNELLYRLEFLFGGKIRYSKSRDIWYWELDSNYAAGVMMTLYSFMSSKRQLEIKNALEAWKHHKNTRDGSQFKDHCDHGHPWIEENLYFWGGRSWCKKCRATSHKFGLRKYRAKLKAAGKKRGERLYPEVIL